MLMRVGDAAEMQRRENRRALEPEEHSSGRGNPKGMKLTFGFRGGDHETARPSIDDRKRC